MKKNFIYSLFAMAALLFATSCQNEDLFGGAQSGDMETVSFSVSTPELGTRAGEGNEIAKLYVGVYEVAKDGLSEPLAASTLDGSIPVVSGQATNVRLELAKNKKYSVIFWAETGNNDDAIFDMNWNNRTMTLKNSLKANQEKYDAFWAQKDVVLTGATAEEVVLNRPFAQLNIGTSDKQIAADAGIVVTKSQVVVETPSVFSLQDGSVSATKSVTYEMSDIYTGTFPVVGNEYLSLNYLLVGADEKALVDVAFSYKDAEDLDAYNLNFSSIPVQRNYRTNIYGTLLTNAADYTVTIDANFGNNDEDATDVVYVTSAEELNAALQADKEEIKIVLLNDVTINGGTSPKYGSNKTQQITIQANDASNLRSASGKTTLTFKDSYRTYVGMENPEGKMIFKNIDIVRETTGGAHWHDNNMKFTSNTEFTNVNFNKGICLDNAKTFTLTNCSINKGKVATYGMFITAGCTVTIDGLNITHSEGVAGRGIKIVDEDVAEKDALTTLSVANAKFVTEAKAAILVGSEGGAKITLSNIDLSGVKADQFNAVWVDEDYKEYADKVTVEGGFIAVEGETPTAENNPFLVEGNTVKVAKGVYSALPKVANGVTIEAEEGTVFTGISQVSGENVTIKNVTFSNTTTKGQSGEIYALSQSLRGTTFENCHFDAMHGARWCYAYGDVVFNKCTFGNETSKRGVHFDGGTGTITFNNCTFYGFNALGSSLEKLTFNDCDIKVSSQAHNGFNGVNMYGTTYEYNDCRFEPKTYTDCTNKSAVVASYTNCSYTDGQSIYSLVRFDGDPAICTITFDGKQMASTSAQLANAVAAMEGTEATFVLAKGTFALPTSLSGKTIVFEGANKEATIIDMTHGGTPQYGAKSVTFKNLTMKRQAEWIGGFAHSEAENYEDCIVEGTLVTYCPTVTATRTNFVPAAKEYYNVHLYSPGTMTFTDCNFTTTRGRSIYAHHDNNASEYDITINGCTFTTGEMSADDSQNQAAIRLHTEAGIHGTLTINNSTATGWKATHNGGLWVEWNNSTKFYTNNFVKTIDGVTVVNADVYTGAQLQTAINNAADGAVITLAPGTYEGLYAMKSGVTITSLYKDNMATVDCINLNGADNVSLKNIKFDAAGAQMAYDGKGGERYFGNIISGGASKNGKGSNGLVIDGCVFTGTFANGGTTIAFNDQGRGTGQSGNITIKNCTFETVGGYVDIYTYYSGKDYLKIENNTFNSTVVDRPIYLGRYQSSTPVVVKGNDFKKVADFAAAAYIQAHSTAYTVSFDESGNTFAQ